MRRKTEGERDATRERTNGVTAALECTTDLGLAHNRRRRLGDVASLSPTDPRFLGGGPCAPLSILLVS
jgi:hypothetical protein